MPILKTLAALALIGAAGAAGVALAGDTSSDLRTGFHQLVAQAVPADQTQAASTEGRVLDVREIVDRLSQLGYSDIREIEREDGRYEVKARASDGTRQEVYLDARTGAVLKTETDDD